MLNAEVIKQIAEENDTSRAIFSKLNGRQRSRSRINIRALKYDLLMNGQKVVEEEFLGTFKKLMDLGVGSLVVGRGGNPTRFIWNYKLRDVAKAAGRVDIPSVPTKKAPETKIKLAKREEPIVKEAKAPISITFNLSPNIRGEDLAALISLAKELESK